MLNALGTIAAVALVPLVAVLLSSFYFLDRLVRHEYSFHRQAWERDGRPFTPFARPRETTWFGSGFALQRCALSWPLYTPQWIRSDSAAKALHTRLRWCVLVWNVGFILLLALVFLALRRYETSNQAMQLTARKPHVCASGVCRRKRMLRFMHRGLAAADLVTR